MPLRRFNQFPPRGSSWSCLKLDFRVRAVVGLPGCLLAGRCLACSLAPSRPLFSSSPSPCCSSTQSLNSLLISTARSLGRHSTTPLQQPPHQPQKLFTMGATRAQKEAYFVKLRALIEEFRECCCWIGDDEEAMS